MKGNHIQMAKTLTRRERRVLTDSISRKRRSNPDAADQTSAQNLLMQLATSFKSGAGASGNPADNEDEDPEDKNADDLMDFDLNDLLGGDTGETDEDEDTEDDEDGGQTDVTLTADQLDAMIDAALDVEEDEEDGSGAGMSGLSAQVLLARKSQKLAQQKKAAAQKVLKQINAELEGVKLPASVKKLLINMAVRHQVGEAERMAGVKAAQIELAHKKELKSGLAAKAAMGEMVDSLVEEKLMNTRMGRSMSFGGFSTQTEDGTSRERGNKGFGRGLDRPKLGSVNQLSGQYRRGTPEFKLVDLMRASVDQEFGNRYKKEFKALGGSSGSAGGYIVPQDWADDFIRLLRAKAVVRKIARIYPMTTETLHLPKQTGTASAGWVGENTDLTSGMTDQTFNEIVFNAKKLRAFSISGNELLNDSTYQAEKIIREDLQDAIVLMEDLTFLTATASSTQPGGIYTAVPTANKFAGAGTANALTPDDIYKLLNRVQKNNARLDCFITSADGLQVIQTLKDTTGNYIFSESGGYNAPQQVIEVPYGEDPENYNAPVGKLLGRDVYIENQIPSTVTIATNSPTALTGGTAALLFGGMKNKLLIGQRAQIEIAASNVAGNAFQNDQTYFRAILREDFQMAIAGAWGVVAFPVLP
jgi:HK97 family phage major capsid protein